MIEKIIDDIEKQKITIKSWLWGFVGILFVRFILEGLSSPTYSGIISSDTYTLVHYGLYFTAVTIATSLIFGYLIKNYLVSLKYLLFGLPIIWVAPLLDIILSRGSGFKMSYLYSGGKNLLFDFITFFGPNFEYGATLGIRVGIAISVFGICYIIWRKSNSLPKTIVGFVSIYLIVFIFFSLPSTLFFTLNTNVSSVSTNTIINFFEKIIFNSNIIHNTLHEGFDSVSKMRMIELGFNKVMSQILFVFSFLLGLCLFWKIDSKKFKVVLKNSRIERIMSYQVLLLSGAGFAYINNLSFGIHWFDFVGLTCLLISWFALWMHAVHINDVEDVEIDKISNKNRPLISGSLSIEDMDQIGFVWLVIALLGSWCAGFYPFFMSLVYIFSYYIYSASPLRLRRFPVVSNFLISIAGLSTIHAGFFFVSADKRFAIFPIFLSIGIITMIILAINTKDMKDIEGDRENGIMTVPTLFPKTGPVIVGVCFALSILLVPIFLKLYILYLFSIPLSLLGYKYINKKPYREKPLFYVRFIFILCVIVTYLTLYIIGNVYNLS